MTRATKSTPKNDEAEKPSPKVDGTVISLRYCSSSASTLRMRRSGGGRRPEGALGQGVVMFDAVDRQRPPTQELLAQVVDEGAVPAQPGAGRAVQARELDHHLVDPGDVRGTRDHVKRWKTPRSNGARAISALMPMSRPPPARWREMMLRSRAANA